jgi:ribonuclease HI
MKTLIAYTDGGSRGNRDAASAVHCILEKINTAHINQETSYTFGKYIGQRTNNEAEYEALILALEFALKLGYGKLIVYSDSQFMVRQIQGAYRVNAPTILPLYEKAMVMVYQLDFEIHHIPREQNTKADAEVNRILDKHQGKTKE